MRLHPSLRECSECGGLLEEPSGSSTILCHSCHVEAEFLLFPALAHPSGTGQAGEAVTSQEEATCFFHEGKRAAAACDSCGRFLCHLCRIDWGSRVLCPACVSAAQKNTDLVTRFRVLDDSIALGIAGFSILIFYLSIMTLPVALVFAIKSFRSKGSLVRKTRARAWMAILLALLQLGGWAWFLSYILLRSKV